MLFLIKNQIFKGALSLHYYVLLLTIFITKEMREEKDETTCDDASSESLIPEQSITSFKEYIFNLFFNKFKKNMF